MNIALLTAAGIGTRMGQSIPKQFMYIDDKPLIIHTLEIFQKHPAIDKIIIVTLPSWKDVLKAYANQFEITKLEWIVDGGANGQDSINKGLMELKKHCKKDDVIIIHDGNRCHCSSEIISDALAVYKEKGNAVAVIPCVEVVYYSENNSTSSDKALSRENLYRTQTPHVFSLGKLLWAHEEAFKRNITNTAATCSLMTMLGETIYFSKGSESNLKITTVEDLMIFKALLKTKKDDWIK